ncbi:MAG TPA: septal ring lytic transglycosylase RlpA family protein [Anaeromyxobacteraceae bacterium]|nr:septal ring lytic transglycosylase RlpA family protein [Anaeromyxobacteraceae bacterium]
MLAAALAACAHGRPAGEGPVEVGLASFYGRELQGRRTASGERYDPRGLTCASRTFPIGSRVRVTDLDTGRSVEATVNDRGPWVKGRVVDLSVGAARALGILERGVARVRVERAD